MEAGASVSAVVVEEEEDSVVVVCSALPSGLLLLGDEDVIVMRGGGVAEEEGEEEEVGGARGLERWRGCWSRRSGWSPGSASEAQPKYTPDLASAIQGVAASSTGRFAVGIPSSLDPRPKPEMTTPSICSGNGGDGPEEG